MRWITTKFSRNEKLTWRIWSRRIMREEWSLSWMEIGDSSFVPYSTHLMWVLHIHYIFMWWEIFILSLEISFKRVMCCAMMVIGDGAFIHTRRLPSDVQNVFIFYSRFLGDSILWFGILKCHSILNASNKHWFSSTSWSF